MLIWFAETTLIATLLAAAAALAGRYFRLAPVARHAFWLVVLAKLLTPPLVAWPRMATPVAPQVAATVADPASRITAMVKDRLMRTLTTKPVPAASPSAPASWCSPLPLPDTTTIGRTLVGAWAIASVVLGLGQLAKILRFRRRFRLAVPAPQWLEDEARLVGDCLGVKAPEVLVVPGSMTPLLWCLGRPKLLLPESLTKSLDADGWRGILAHELAHLKRRDHWVRRLEMLAGLVWWWNPVFWITRGRLDAEAELACDECAVRAFPEGRLAYAEALLEVCRLIASPKPPVPALGIAGVGRFHFLERRVSMILRDPSPSRSLTPVLLSAGLLAMLALPAWSSAVTPVPLVPAAAPVCDPAPDAGLNTNINMDDDDDEDEKDDDKAEKKKAEKRAKAKAMKAKAKADAAAKKGQEVEVEVEIKADLDAKIEKANDLAARLSEKLGPGSDFEKAMTKLGPELEKAMKGVAGGLEEALGPDSEFAKQMTEAFGPDSELAKELKEAFGPDSEFAKELKEAFGPDGEFAREMQEAFGPDGELARELKAAFGPDGEVTQELKAAAEEMKAAKAEAEVAKKIEKKSKAEATAKKTSKQDARAKARAELKAQIEALSKKLEALEEDDDEDNDDK